MIIQYPFDNANDYIYESNKLEFVNGKCRVKSIDYSTINNLTFYANYSNTVDGTWGLGDITATLSDPSITINDGKLDLTGWVGKYVDYSAYLNADSRQEGCIRIKIIPNYSGSPSYYQVFILITYNETVNNLINLFHGLDGILYTNIFDQDGTKIGGISWGNWSPVAGEFYELELNYNLDIGEVRLFINGNQFGNTYSVIGTRSSDINILRIGTNTTGATGTYKNNFYLDDLQIYSAVQHTTNYTPQDMYSYNVGEIFLYPSDSFRTDEISSISLTSSNNVRIILLKNGVEYYYNGNNWVESDGSYSQANDIGDLTTSILDKFADNNNIPFKWKLVFNSDGYSELYVDNLSIDYSFAGENVTLNTALIYGFYYEKGSPVQGAIIKCRTNYLFGNDSSLICGIQEYETTTDNIGYWEINIVYEDVQPEYLIWNINGKIIKTNFLTGTHKFGELTQLSLY